MSPEQARGDPLDARSDLFSLGVVLYEMATGALPFQGATATEVLDEVLQKTPPSVRLLNPNTPRALQDIVARCLEKSAALRFDSATAIENDLSAITYQPGVEPSGATASSPAYTGIHTSLWLAGAILTALISIPVYRYMDIRSAMQVRSTRQTALDWALQAASKWGCPTSVSKPRITFTPAFEMDEVLATEGIGAARRIVHSGHSFAWQIDFSTDPGSSRASGSGCSVLLDVSGLLLEFRSNDRLAQAVSPDAALRKRAADLAGAVLHLAPGSSPSEWNRWIVPASASGWHEEISVSLTQSGQVLRLARLLLRDQKTHLPGDFPSSAAMLTAAGVLFALGLYCDGVFILLKRWRFLVLPWRVLFALALSPALATTWLFLALEGASAPSPAVLWIAALTAGLIVLLIILPAMAGLFASIRHRDYDRSWGRDSASTVRRIADGVLAGTVVAGFYVVRAVVVQWSGRLPDMQSLKLGLAGGSPWMFGEVGLALGAAAWTILLVTTYLESVRLLQAPRPALIASALLVSLLTVDVQTLHLLPCLLSACAVACQLMIYRTSGLPGALAANLSSMMFLASITGLHLGNRSFANQSLVIGAAPLLLLGVVFTSSRWKSSVLSQKFV